jgi:4,5-DOPA dioxygenase extradiol
MDTTLAPVLYLPHGGGPMPLLDDPAYAGLIRFLKNLPQTFATPDAIVLVSAHWEALQPTVSAAANPALLFDYSGFPPQSYRFTWPAPGSPLLASRIAALLKDAGIPGTQNTERGFDHGVFVPMLLMYPEANIPCVQLSLIEGLDAASHVQLGLALRSLRSENIVIIGSGMSFHNMRALFAGERADFRQASDAYADWLVQTMTDSALDNEERMGSLVKWRQAPYAQFCHPREEHLLPLHVCLGAAGGEKAALLFDEPLMGHRVTGFGWGLGSV